jgi:alpha-1,3-rhamnosyl/mannosyltransferase
MFQGFYARSLLSSDAALAVSHSTKADASWLTDFDQDRIRVAHSGPTLCIASHRHAAPVRRRPEVGLVVSTLEPRKNAFFLLDWFRQTSALPPGAELWWVGPMGWLTSREQLRPYRSIGGGRRIRFLGVVSDSDLCRLYQTAGWSIYPSLYEGFGFPVLDSLRHGTPVLTSYNSSIREFDAPGLHFFDPCDPATVDEAFASFVSAPGAPPPAEQLDAHYTWDRVARSLLGLIPATPARSHTRARAAVFD